MLKTQSLLLLHSFCLIENSIIEKKESKKGFKGSQPKNKRRLSKEIKNSLSQSPKNLKEMRHKSCIVLMLFMMLVLTESNLVESRTLRSKVKSKFSNGAEAVGVRRFIKTEDTNSGVRASDQVYTMSSGPSRKGSGH